MIETPPLAWVAVAASSAAMAAALMMPRRPTAAGLTARWGPAVAADSGWLVRYRWLLSLLAGLGGAVLLPGWVAIMGAPGVAAGVWVVIGRAEPLGVRLEREQASKDLVPLVDLIAAALASGAPPETALAVACEALPGAAARRLDVVRAEMALGGDSDRAWSSIVGDEVLAPLGRAITRASRSGAPIAATVGRLAGELSAESRAGVEDRARIVGVKAAVPLGLCLLPSFLLIGIVPVAAGLLDSLT